MSMNMKNSEVLEEPKQKIPKDSPKMMELEITNAKGNRGIRSKNRREEVADTENGVQNPIRARGRPRLVRTGQWGRPREEYHH